MKKKRFYYFEIIVICIFMMNFLLMVKCFMGNVIDGFISFVMCMIYVKCFRKWVNVFKYDDIKVV